MKKLVRVERYVEVDIDESKFNQEFFDEFNDYICDYGYSLDKHIENLAYNWAMGYCDFIEGYGQLDEMGIKFREDDCIVEIEE